MSKARRDTKWRRCSIVWNGTGELAEQRRTTPFAPEAVVSRTVGVLRLQGQVVGKS